MQILLGPNNKISRSHSNILLFTHNGLATSITLTPQQSHETKPSGDAPNNGTLGFLTKKKQKTVSCTFTFLLEFLMYIHEHVCKF